MNRKRKNILLVFGTRPEAIKIAPLLINRENHYNAMSKAINPYGYEQACDRIAGVLK